jgi:hypothetical protein
VYSVCVFILFARALFFEEEENKKNTLFERFIDLIFASLSLLFFQLLFLTDNNIFRIMLVVVQVAQVAVVMQDVVVEEEDIKDHQE